MARTKQPTRAGAASRQADGWRIHNTRVAIIQIDCVERNGAKTNGRGMRENQPAEAPRRVQQAQRRLTVRRFVSQRPKLADKIVLASGLELPVVRSRYAQAEAEENTNVHQRHSGQSGP
jgi:hypothetical protein